MERKEVEEKLLARRVVLLDSQLESDLLRKIRGQILFLNLESNEDIKILIDSGGGRIIPTLYLFDAIKMSTAKIIGIVNGICNSAALTLLQACHKRFSTPHSTFLLHFVRNSDFEYRADYDDARLEKAISFAIKMTRELQEKTESIIGKRSGMSAEAIRKRMEESENFDTRITAQEALSLNLIDEVVETLDLRLAENKKD